MGENIFHQILDSERIFKCRIDEITKYKDKITSLEKHLVHIQENTKSTENSIIKQKTDIENGKIMKDSLQKRLVLITNHCEDLKKNIEPVKDELQLTNERHATLRADLTNHLKSQNAKLFEMHSNLNMVDDDQYSDYCDKKKELEEIRNDNLNLENKLQNLQKSLSDIAPKIVSLKANRDNKRHDLEQTRGLLEGRGFSTMQQNHIHRLSNTIACFEKDITSMTSEISKKREFMQSFNYSSSNYSNNLQQSPRVATATSSVYNTQNKLRYSNPYSATAASNTIINSETQQYNENRQCKVVQPVKYPQQTGERSNERRVVQHIRYPQSTQSDDELMFDDDDIPNSQLIKACEEAERIEKQK